MEGMWDPEDTGSTGHIRGEHEGMHGGLGHMRCTLVAFSLHFMQIITPIL